MVLGWLLALTTLVLLSGLAQRLAFVLAALLVELLGFALLTHHYRSLQRGNA
jgi:hypothetical protein